MINFVYWLIIAAYLILIAGFLFKDYTITLLGSIFLIIMGVYGVINGYDNQTNFGIYVLALITMFVGIYVLIRGSLEMIKEKGS